MILAHPRTTILATALCISINLNAQEKQDSIALVQQIAPVEIQAYFSKQPLLTLTSSAQIIDQNQLSKLQTTTLLPALNTVPGLRMEERSPGSYRLALRGSMIRSPFGVRNIKIYMDEFPLTDAGGNSYINLLDPSALAAIYVLKGPDGSLYGSNSGGVIRMQPKGFDSTENRSELLLSGGSYGLAQEQLSLQRKISPNYSFSFDQSFTRADGYRQNTALNKKTFQTAHQWKYSKNNELRLFALYADLGYRTPGGLTQAQYDEDPRMARPAAGPNPGALEQQAGIYNKTFFAGLAHTAKLTSKLTHSISIFGSTTDLQNPFITNYEVRDEKNLGLRSYFSYVQGDRPEFQWQMQVGFEGQKGWNKIDNFDNAQGIATDRQAEDKLDNDQYGLFYRAMVKIHQRLTMEGSLGLNKSSINYTQLFPAINDGQGTIDFGNTWMPRLAASYLIQENFALRASISKGYSAPTLAEVRSSDNLINRDLKAETGTNYEAGLRYNSPNRRIIADLAYYTYSMKNGIIRQLRESGAEYYLNAGEMKQQGLEASVWAHLVQPNQQSFIRSLAVNTNVSYNHYRFGNYQIADKDYSGNNITAVPDWVWVSQLTVDLPKQMQVQIQHNYTSKSPLDDANTVYAEKYNLVQAKASWTTAIGGKSSIQFFLGVDNLFNEEYSLGNDINAFGGRYFNPAPRRNAYAGLKLSL